MSNARASLVTKQLQALVRYGLAGRGGRRRVSCKMRHGLGLLLALALHTTAMAADYDSAMALFDRGEYARALPIVEKAAKGGNAAAQNTLGVMYDRGLGTAPDLAQAVTWF